VQQGDQLDWLLRLSPFAVSSSGFDLVFSPLLEKMGNQMLIKLKWKMNL
jgi:hypothetical protein